MTVEVGQVYCVGDRFVRIHSVVGLVSLQPVVQYVEVDRTGKAFAKPMQLIRHFLTWWGDHWGMGKGFSLLQFGVSL